MENKVYISDLSSILASRQNITKTEAEQFAKSFFDIIKQRLIQEGYVKVKGLGTFKLMAVSERESVDVNTGNRIEISAHSRIAFTPDATIAKRVNQAFGNFETVVLEEGENSEELGETVSADSPVLETETEATETVHSVYLGSDDDVEDTSESEESEEDESEALQEQLDDETTHTTENKDVATKETTNEYEWGESDEEEDTESPFFVWMKASLLGLLVIIILLVCYFLGYYRLLGNTDVFHWDVHEYIDTSTVSAVPDTSVAKYPVDSLKKDSVRKAVIQKARQVEKEKKTTETPKYEQMPGGKYVITGVLEKHTLESGESIIRLSKKIYGDKDMAAYVVFFNHIKNPDVVPVGTEIQFPRLEERK